MKNYSIVVKVEPDGLPIRLHGRAAWMMRKLVEAGKSGVTPLDLPTGVRAAHFVYLLRRDGFIISTEHEAHGGPFKGVHGRYRAEGDITILEDMAVAA